MNIDLSLENASLYDGCNMERVAGRLNLKTPVSEAVDIIGANIHRIVRQTPASDRDVCTLTGGMSIWAYLVVFHEVVHAFREIRYEDGRNDSILIARHG